MEIRWTNVGVMVIPARIDSGVKNSHNVAWCFECNFVFLMSTADSSRLAHSKIVYMHCAQLYGPFG
jgi:hypothetical protein